MLSGCREIVVACPAGKRTSSPGSTPSSARPRSASTAPWLGAPPHPGRHLPVDYGYLDGTTGGDGDGIDVFRGSTIAGVVAVALTADLTKRDVEVKLLLGCTPEEITAVERFLRDVLGIGGPVVQRE